MCSNHRVYTDSHRECVVITELCRLLQRMCSNHRDYTGHHRECVLITECTGYHRECVVITEITQVIIENVW